MPRADEAGGLYHALKRGNLRAVIFRKDADYDAFERIFGQQRVLTPLICSPVVCLGRTLSTIGSQMSDSTMPSTGGKLLFTLHAT